MLTHSPLIAFIPTKDANKTEKPKTETLKTDLHKVFIDQWVIEEGPALEWTP
jgi:hypothetical protein